MMNILKSVNNLILHIGRLIPQDLIAIAGRFFIAETFYLAGRTKVVEGSLLTVSENTYYLFEHYYALPIIPPVIVAHMATYAEHLFALLIILGLMTRFSALALLIMTLTIQIFVLPTGYNVHLGWAVALLFLMKYGAGHFSLDFLACRLFCPRKKD